MTKKLVSFDDQAVGSGLPAVVEAELNATYGTKGEVEQVAARAAALPRVAQVLADTRASDARVAITRTSETEYQLWQAMGNRRWWRSRLVRSDAIQFHTSPGGYLNYQLHYSYVTYPMVGVDEGATSVDSTAGTWTAGANAATFGGTYVRSNIAGDKITFTTPADTVAVGLHGVDVSNAGISRVLIDGDPTLANVLPTAQELVTAGTLPSTVLVANGGPLAPTDRVLDQYLNGTTWGAPRLLAEDLPSGSHTVTVEVTGVKRDAATDNRAYVSGFAYTTRTTSPATAGVSSFDRIVAVPRDSAWEYAHSIKPDGATSFIFSGNIHGYEEQTGLTVTLDGQTITPAIGATHVGRVLVIDKTSILRHPDTGTTDLATVDMTYTLTGNGLRIRHTTNWIVGGSCSAAYPAMFPVNREVFPVGMIDTLPTDIDVTRGDGLFDGRVRGNLIGALQPSGGYAAVLHVPDPAVTVNEWEHSGTGSDPVKASNLSIEDRAGNVGVRLGKFYVTRISNQISGGVPYAAGEVWESDCLYRVAHVARGAYAALSNNA